MQKTSIPALDLIFARRSVRVYAPGEVGDDVIQKLLEAAMAAPSAAAADPWRFVVIRSRELLGKMAEALPFGRMISSAALGVVVCGDQQASHDQQLSYLLQDCSAATENLLLAAQALGLGACWLGIHPRQQRVESVSRLLSLPPGVIPVCCIAIGRPGEEKEARTRFNASHVHYEKW